MTTAEMAAMIRQMIRALGQIPPSLSDEELVRSVAELIKVGR